MLTKSRLKKLFVEHGFRPLKRLGENYLIDGNIKDKIIGTAAAGPGDTVLEIGPGLGALTIDLAESGAAVYAVEKDRLAFSILKEMTASGFPRLKLFHCDILKFDLEGNIPAGDIKVVGNLPYYITTPIIEYLIENRSSIRSVVMTVQKEVAGRLLASEGDEDYGSISCFVRYYTKPSYIYTIKRASFYPSPEVDSAIVRLDMLERPSVRVKDEELFFRIVRSSFNQRRKSIINSLSRGPALGIPKEELAAILDNIGIDPRMRPERLGLADFARIADAVSKN